VIAPGSADRCGSKRAVNADNFAVATEEPIVSVVYELELVPVVLIQQGFARRPVVLELGRSSEKPSFLVRRRFERSNKSGSSASFPPQKGLTYR